MLLIRLRVDLNISSTCSLQIFFLEIILLFQEKTESEQADSIAPTDLVTSPCSTPLFRSVINLSVSSLSEGVYCEHYDLGRSSNADKLVTPLHTL